MFTITFEKDSISFIFDKECVELKNTVIDIITNSFSKPIICVFEFYGVSADEIIDDFKSKQHILILDKKRKIFKDLPRLYVTSKYLEDISVFKSNIGSYNEGNMYLYYLNENTNDDFLSGSDTDRIQEIIDKNTILSIEIGSDGDSFEVCCSSTNKLVEICNLINKHMFKNDSL